ncbi:hypothetical protein [Sorangium sp. So ce854]|uniref:hypothetical protein n=1 Tax=Sorangium sp. So ce854 TaxID=3133322 RepID=UPI003F63C66F
MLDAFIQATLGDAGFVSTLIQPETSRAFGHVDPRVVVAIPMKETEAWVVFYRGR